MKKIVSLVAILTITAPIAVLAQVGPPGDDGRPERGQRRGPSPERLAAALELDDEQVAAVEALFEAHRVSMEPLQQQIRGLNEELETLIEGTSPDPTAVGNLVLEIHGLRGDSESSRQKLKADIETLLTAEQLQKWELLETMRPERRRGRKG